MKELAGLNSYFARYKGRMILGIIFTILSNWFGVFPAQVVRLAFDLVKDQIASYQLLQGFEFQLQYYKLFAGIVLLFGLVIIAVVVIKGIFMFFMRQTIIVVSRLIEYDLKNTIYEHYQSLSLSFYRRNNTGDLMNRVSEDVSRVRMYIGPAIMYTLNLLVLFILVISTMIKVNPLLTLYAVAPLPFLFVAIYMVQNVINQKSEQIQAQLSRLSTNIQESFSGIRVIKAFAREHEIIEEFNAESHLYREKSMSLAKTQAVFFPAVLVIVGISTILTVYIGGLEVMRGSITAGNIAEFIVYVNLLTWPIASVGWVTSLVQRAAASQKRINEFLDSKPEIADSLHSKDITIAGKITFKDVALTYPETGIEALKNLSFEIEAGKTLAIVGKTGSGKSTIANLLFRMFDPSQGMIYIDNQPLNSLKLLSLRKQMSLVPQEVFLFSDTIKNNIAFGAEEADLSQITAAAKSADVYENIMGFADGFETKVGERGITLSGGQKQRISIARAIIRNSSIIIFDDALSAVDTKTEAKILENLRQIRKNRTSIIISHRISTIKDADQILYMDQGRVIERGTHHDLIALGGSYANLYQKQLLEEEIFVED